MMRGRTLCVVVHDVSPATWDACCELLHEVERVGKFPVTLLAVPHYHGVPRNAAFEAWLRHRAKLGDEIALHGFTHRDSGVPSGWIDHVRRRHYTCGEGEFSALTLAQATRRIAAGMRWMIRIGLQPAGFVAPAWLLSPGTWQALRQSHRFAYTCTLRELHALPDGPVLVAQSQVYSSRSAWRRVLSIAWNRWLAHAQRKQACVRVELHPADAAHAAIVRCWSELLWRQSADREAVTLAGMVRRMRRPEAAASEQQQHELGGREADRAADQHVARVVQTEHHA